MSNPSDMMVVSTLSNMPPADQRASRLLRLPSEIRLIILRILLVHSSPLDRVKGLHPQILATCQAFKIEGSAVLYDENILNLHTGRHLSDVYCLPFSNRDISLEEFSKSSRNVECEDFYRFVRRFKQIRLLPDASTFGSKRLTAFAPRVPQLRPLIIGKHVELVVKPWKPLFAIFNVGEPVEKFSIDCVKAFKALRCHRFKVDLDWASEYSTVLRDIEDTVMSNTSATLLSDLYEPCEPLEGMIKQAYKLLGDEDAEGAVFSKFILLWKASLTFEVYNFMAIQDEILEEYQQVTSQLLERAREGHPQLGDQQARAEH